MDCIPSSLSGRQTNNSNSIQNLSSVLNNPHSFKSSSDPSGWLGWWSVAPPDFTPIITKHPPPDISQSNFLPYLSSISDTYSRFEDIMKKIKAVLDQETWLEVDVPDEFQAIVASLFYSEPLISEALNDTRGEMTTSYGEVGTSNDGSLVTDTETQNAEQKLVRMNTKEVSLQNSVQKKSTPSTEPTESNKVMTTTSSAQHNNHKVKERGKSTTQTLSCGGVGYHMVNCGLILLKMLSEYIDMNNLLPTLSSEVVHRVVEILKFFNTRTCQLILGAGAMQVSGLKSITSKHLALASQVISFVYAIIPEIRRALFLKVPEARKALLLSEIDRVAQDFKVHQEEILTKLVQIMRERVLYHLRKLPPVVESWNIPVDTDSQPSLIAKEILKEVNYLQRILSRILHEADIPAIFRAKSQKPSSFFPLGFDGNAYPSIASLRSAVRKQRAGFTGILHLSLNALDHYLLVAQANLIPLTGDNLMNFSNKDLGLKLAEKCLQGSNWLLYVHTVKRFLWKIWDARTSSQPIHLPCRINWR